MSKGEKRNPVQQARQTARQIMDRYDSALKASTNCPCADCRQRYMRARRSLIGRLTAAP